MERILIVYGTTQGWTTRIVERMADVLREMGMVPTIHPADNPPPNLDLLDFNGALLAGSVQFGRHQRSLEKFATRHAIELGQLPASLREFPADEIVVSTHPPGRSHWLELGVVENARMRFDVPVTHVVVDLELTDSLRETI